MVVTIKVRALGFVMVGLAISLCLGIALVQLVGGSPPSWLALVALAFGVAGNFTWMLADMFSP